MHKYLVEGESIHPYQLQLSAKVRKYKEVLVIARNFRDTIKYLYVIPWSLPHGALCFIDPVRCISKYQPICLVEHLEFFLLSWRYRNSMMWFDFNWILKDLPLSYDKNETNCKLFSYLSHSGQNGGRRIPYTTHYNHNCHDNSRNTIWCVIH